MEEVKCKMCENKVRRYPSQIRKKYCSHKCKMSDPDFHEARAKAMWKGTYKQIKRVALKSYFSSGKKLICNECGTKKQIHIHHIDHNRLNNNAINLEALCNSCHNRLHIYKRILCPVCGQIFVEGHRCPSENQRHVWGQRSISQRERCSKCGRVKGIDRHICGNHPRGFLGYHHTESAKMSMSKKNSISKKKWWKKQRGD